MVEMHDVDSRSIRAVGYDEEHEALFVDFRESGDIYAYHPVAREVFEELLAAESRGAYFNQNIRNSYQYLKV